MWQEFKKFVMRGNVLDLAVAVILGAAFGAIVKSLVDDIIMPPIGLLLGGLDFSSLFLTLKQGNPAGPYATAAQAKEAGAVTMNYGIFINNIVTFLIVAVALFLVIRAANKLQRPAPAAPATTKECPHCFTTIPIKANRCPNCTSEL